MSYELGEVVGRVERRRRFTAEQKLAVLAEVSGRDANISAIARRHGLLPSQVYKWRRLAELGVIAIAGASELPSFMAVQVAADGEALLPSPQACDTTERQRKRVTSSGRMEIVLADGRRIRVDRDVDADALQRVVQVLSRG
jgi:transposase